MNRRYSLRSRLAIGAVAGAACLAAAPSARADDLADNLGSTLNAFVDGNPGHLFAQRFTIGGADDWSLTSIVARLGFREGSPSLTARLYNATGAGDLGSLIASATFGFNVNDIPTTQSYGDVTFTSNGSTVTLQHGKSYFFLLGNQNSQGSSTYNWAASFSNNAQTGSVGTIDSAYTFSNDFGTHFVETRTNAAALMRVNGTSNSVVPEPGAAVTAALLGGSLAGLIVRARRRA